MRNAGEWHSGIVEARDLDEPGPGQAHQSSPSHREAFEVLIRCDRWAVVVQCSEEAVQHCFDDGFRHGCHPRTDAPESTKSDEINLSRVRRTGEFQVCPPPRLPLGPVPFPFPSPPDPPPPSAAAAPPSTVLHCPPRFRPSQLFLSLCSAYRAWFFLLAAGRLARDSSSPRSTCRLIRQQILTSPVACSMSLALPCLRTWSKFCRRNSGHVWWWPKQISALFRRPSISVTRPFSPARVRLGPNC